MEMMLAYLVIFGMFFFGIFPVVFALKKAKKHSKEDVLSAEDFKNDEENYMNIITKISPAVLAYVDSMKFNFSQTVTAILLQLKMKEAVKYEKHGLVKLKELTDMKTPEYGDLEKYILGCIKENGQVFASKRDLEELVIKEAKKQNVLEDNKHEKFYKR